MAAKVKYKGREKRPFGVHILNEKFTFDPSDKEAGKVLSLPNKRTAEVLVATAPDLWELVEDEPKQEPTPAVAEAPAVEDVDQKRVGGRFGGKNG